MNQPPIPLERVHGRVRAGTAPVPPARQPAAAGPGVAPDRAGEHRPTIGLGDLVPVAIVVVAAFVSGDVLVSLLAGVAALGALALRRLAGEGRFGFGDGFTAFRADLGWPRGVQEDDDFHWSWSAARDEAGAGRRSLAP